MYILVVLFPCLKCEQQICFGFLLIGKSSIGVFFSRHVGAPLLSYKDTRFSSARLNVLAKSIVIMKRAICPYPSALYDDSVHHHGLFTSMLPHISWPLMDPIVMAHACITCTPLTDPLLMSVNRDSLLSSCWAKTSPHLVESQCCCTISAVSVVML